MLHATHGSTLAYSAATSRRGAVTIVQHASDQQQQQPPPLITLSLLDGPPPETVAAEAAVLALGPHVVGRGGGGAGGRMVYKVWKPPPEQPQQQQWAVDYGDEVLHACLNHGYAAVLVSSGRRRGRVVLHSLRAIDTSVEGEEEEEEEEEEHEEGVRRCFDAGLQGGDGITCMALTDDFLVVGTECGQIDLFSLATWSWVNIPSRPRPTAASILRICPNDAGTHFIYVDANGRGYLHDPLAGDGDGSDLLLPDIPALVTDGQQPPPRILWDQVDRHVIMVHGGGQLHAYTYLARSTHGPRVTKLGAVEVGAADGGVRIQPMAYDFPAGYAPLVSISGRLLSVSVPALSSSSSSSFSSSAKRPPVSLKTFLAPVYQCLLEGQPAPALTGGRSSASAGPDRSLLQAAFNQSLALVRLQDAWTAALRLDDRQQWLALGNKAVEVLNIEMALRVYRQLGDAGMVMGLEPLLAIEDPQLLAGHAALLFGHYDEAERLFLASSRPAAAMEMRRDLLQCDRALQLAQLVAPHEVAATALQYAQQLELHGDDYEAALRMYGVACGRRRGASSSRRGSGSKASDAVNDSLALACAMGQTRCTLRLGHVREGMKLALGLEDRAFFRECAAILAENRATLAEAAALYERAGIAEMAVRLCLQIPDVAHAARLMPRVTLPKLHALFARACEEAGRYADAVLGYERARDLDSIVRLCLSDAYPRPEQAFELVHSTGSAEAAMMAATYHQNRGDVDGALGFLLLAQQTEAAFEYAKAQQRVDAYVQALGGEARLPPAEALRVAGYYEARQQLVQAARVYRRSQRHQPKALKLALQCGAVELAIDIVVAARTEELTGVLLRFLNGDSDGVQKDAHHLHRLHLALGNHDAAAKAADLHATQQQTAGEYAAAHTTLYHAIQALQDSGAPVPSALRAHFHLLHSYVLAKRLIQHDDHRGAARLLLRVARRIASFPAHAVPILTSVAIECQRAGTGAAAFKYASLLVTDPAYRQELDPQLRRKFETIVRRGVGAGDQTSEEEENEGDEEDGEDEEESSRVAVMCIASGRYLGAGAADAAERSGVDAAWCLCPNSRMPALLMEYRRFIDADAARAPEGVAVDPVCGQPVRKADLVRVLAAVILQGKATTARQRQEY